MRPDAPPPPPVGPADLSEGDWPSRLAALRRLPAGSPIPPDLHPALVALLAAPEAEQRAAAVEAVARAGPPIVPLLVAALTRDPPDAAEARRAAVVALGWLGPAARPAVALLRSLASDPWLGPCVGPALAHIRPRGRFGGAGVLVASAAAAGAATLFASGGVAPVAAVAGVVAACVAAGVWWCRPGPAVWVLGVGVGAAALVGGWAGGFLPDVFDRVSRALAGP